MLKEKGRDLNQSKGKSPFSNRTLTKSKMTPQIRQQTILLRIHCDFGPIMDGQLE